MNKLLSMVAVVSILSLGLATASHAGSMAPSGFTTYDTLSLVGSTVKARDGVELGAIYDFVLDSNGHVDFAIVRQSGIGEFPERFVVVPFSTLKISKGNRDQFSIVFNADKEKFYEGPAWGYTKMSDLQQAAWVDRRYGVAPYWTGATENSEHHK
jgi:sporulation protein YlmC with PRC-barrel domain